MIICIRIDNSELYFCIIATLIMAIVFSHGIKLFSFLLTK
jgi:hypothetical protein